MRDFLFPNSISTLLRRYLVVAALHFAWQYANSFDVSTSLDAIFPATYELINLRLMLFYYWPTSILPVSVYLIFAILQWGLVFGAIRLFIRYAGWLLSPEEEAPSPSPTSITIDGHRIQRSGWRTPALMTLAIIASCYLLAWAGWMIGTQRLISLIPAILTLSYWPLLVGLVLGLLGMLTGRRFSSAARSSVGGLANVQYLPDGHHFTLRVQTMAERLGLPKPAVGVTNVVNAFAVGRSHSSAAVVIGTPLVQTLTQDELNAVIGHELGHIVTNDMTSMQFAAGYQSMFGTMISAGARAGAQATRDQNARILVLVIGQLLHVSVMLVSDLLMKGLSRSREFYADAVGAALSSPEAMITALQKVHGVEVAPAPVENRYGYLMFRPRRGMLFSTHPSLESRVQALQRRTYIERIASRNPAPLSAEASKFTSGRPVSLDAFDAALAQNGSAAFSPSMPHSISDVLPGPRPTEPPLSLVQARGPSRAYLLWKEARPRLTSPAAKRVAGAATLIALLVVAWFTVPVASVTATLQDAIGAITGSNVREAEARVAEREHNVALQEADLKRNQGFLDVRATNLAKREEDLRTREITFATREGAVASKEALLNNREQELIRREATFAQSTPTPSPVLQTTGPTALQEAKPSTLPSVSDRWGGVVQGRSGRYYTATSNSSAGETLPQALNLCRTQGDSPCRTIATVGPPEGACFASVMNNLRQTATAVGRDLKDAIYRAEVACGSNRQTEICFTPQAYTFCVN